MGARITRDRIPVEQNVKIIVRERGKIVAHRECHNIVLLPGRTFLRNDLCVSSYPPIPTAAGAGSNPFAQYPGDGSWAVTDRVGLYVPRYCAFGSGGALNGAGGTYTEQQNIGGLEEPLSVTQVGVPAPYTDRYVVQALPQPDLSDPYTFPSNTEVCFRFVVEKSELSFGGAVNVSEILMLDSRANPYRAPSISEFLGLTVPGALAYNIFEPFPDGPDHIFEVLWYWRY